ncbi:MAG: thiamine biosynthesis protein ThiS [Phycisphaerae bacterium]|nr:thiamine biosynthesis protein ThiS [Phycisphaerae bacterium]
MSVTVNGSTRELPEGCTIAELITELGLAEAICAAELNERVVPVAERADSQLNDGDRIEIVTLVGGG